MEVAEDIGDFSPAEEGETEQTAVPSKFRVTVTTGAEYTSNARRMGSHGSDDVVWTPALEVGYATPLGHGFSLDAIARVDAALFSDHHEQSFGGYSSSLFLNYRCRPNLPRIYAGSEAYRFERRFGDKITQAAVPKIGIDHGIAFNKDRSAVFFGYDYGIFLTSPDLDSRDAHRLIAGLSHQAAPSVFVQTFYSFMFSDYDEYRREDSRNLVALNVIYQFTPHFFGTLTTSYQHNHSTFELASYESVTAGVMFGLQF